MSNNENYADAILDLLFFVIEQKRCEEGARSHYKKGTAKYEWFDGFVKQYEGAEVAIREYLQRKADFEKVYAVWRNKQ